MALIFFFLSWSQTSLGFVHTINCCCFLFFFWNTLSYPCLILPESGYIRFIFDVSAKITLLCGYLSPLKFWHTLFLALIILDCVTCIWFSLVYIYKWSYIDINTLFLFLPNFYTPRNSLAHPPVLFLKLLEMRQGISKQIFFARPTTKPDTAWGSRNRRLKKMECPHYSMFIFNKHTNIHIISGKR